MGRVDKPTVGRELLTPAERAAEIMFGVVMTLSVIAAMRVGPAEQFESRTLLLTALGCNLAWGFVDAAMYLLSTLLERIQSGQTTLRMRAARDAQALRSELLRATPSGLIEALPEQAIEEFRVWLGQQPAPPPVRLRADDFRAAGAIWLLVFLSTLPLVLPFIIISDPGAAVRASHAVAIAMLFGLGVKLANWLGFRPWLTGLASATLGVIIAATCIVLGG